MMTLLRNLFQRRAACLDCGDRLPMIPWGIETSTGLTLLCAACYIKVTT